MEFISTFKTHEYDIYRSHQENLDLTHYMCLLSFEGVFLSSDTRQALAFIGGYAAFSLLRKLSKSSDLCPDCYSILTENKYMEIEDPDSTFALIGLLDRGGLKWPSNFVLNAVFTLWKVFTMIERSPVHLKNFLRSDSKSILVQLTLLKLDSGECEDFIYECIDCCTEGKALLVSILTTLADCLLNNKAKNLNVSTTCPKESHKKFLKLSSK